MTDNKVNVDQYGNESVTVNRGDGLAISEIKKLGIHQIIISTEKNVVVQKIARRVRQNTAVPNMAPKSESFYIMRSKLRGETILYCSILYYATIP